VHSCSPFVCISVLHGCANKVYYRATIIDQSIIFYQPFTTAPLIRRSEAPNNKISQRKSEQNTMSLGTKAKRQLLHDSGGIKLDTWDGLVMAALCNRAGHMPPCVIGQVIILLSCGFFFFLSFFPRLISAVADWMSPILLHMVWP